MHIDIQTRHTSRLARNALALILADGRGVRLQDLTQWRAKPAVHFGGNFRIIPNAIARRRVFAYPFRDPETRE
jgi:hypothetical protein